MADETQVSSVIVINHQIPAFQKRLDTLNKKAEKFGLSPIAIRSTEDVVYE